MTTNTIKHFLNEKRLAAEIILISYYFVLICWVNMVFQWWRLEALQMSNVATMEQTSCSALWRANEKRAKCLLSDAAGQWY